jgi:hypothetical protein
MPYLDAQRASKFYETVFGGQTKILGAEMGNFILSTTAVEDTNSVVPREFWVSLPGFRA